MYSLVYLVNEIGGVLFIKIPTLNSKFVAPIFVDTAITFRALTKTHNFVTHNGLQLAKERQRKELRSK